MITEREDYSGELADLIIKGAWCHRFASMQFNLIKYIK